MNSRQLKRLPKLIVLWGKKNLKRNDFLDIVANAKCQNKNHNLQLSDIN